MYDNLKSDILYSVIVNNVGTLFAGWKDYEQAKKCFLESIEFIPEGADYKDPFLGLKEL